jgi:helicase SWR1
MSSNELETMSPSHTLDGLANGDVSNANNSHPVPQTTPSVPQTECPVDLTVVETRESSRSVAVSLGKRRKVSTTETSNAPVERRTRSRVSTSHSLNLIKPTLPKYKSVDQIKDAAKSQRQKTLHTTFERHDTKLRELFHLTKFVTLVDYDAKTAKEDQSEVFQEVFLPLNIVPDHKQFKAPYELWQKVADAKTGGRVRSTRHAINTQRDVLGSAFTQPSPKVTSATAKHLQQSRPKRSLGGDVPNYAMPKRGRRSSTSIPPVENGLVSKVHKRKASNDKLLGPFTENSDIFSTRSPRFKLKYRAPEPLITHPLHLPLPKQFNSLGEYLDSYIQLDDHEDTTLEKAQQKALHEASIRNRIDIARARGWLGDSASPAAPRKQPEPSTIQTRHDIMLKHVINFSSLMAQERRSNISRAKKIAQMIAQHFKRLEGTDEKEIKAEEKRIRRLAKWTAQEVRKKWKLAERV